MNFQRSKRVILFGNVDFVIIINITDAKGQDAWFTCLSDVRKSGKPCFGAAHRGSSELPRAPSLRLHCAQHAWNLTYMSIL